MKRIVNYTQLFFLTNLMFSSRVKVCPGWESNPKPLKLIAKALPIKQPEPTHFIQITCWQQLTLLSLANKVICVKCTGLLSLKVTQQAELQQFKPNVLVQTTGMDVISLSCRKFHSSDIFDNPFYKIKNNKVYFFFVRHLLVFY